MVNTKRKLNILLAGIVSVTSGVVAYWHAVPEVDAVTCDPLLPDVPCEQNVNFNVNVVESLSVTVTTPAEGEWASGNYGTFLRNKVNLLVSTSNSAGYTASMYSKNEAATAENLTDLSSTAGDTIQTLSGAIARSDFDSNLNKWGYSLSVARQEGSPITTAETEDGSASATYAAMTADTSAPSLIRKHTGSAATNESTDIYFGTKADITQAAGTYQGDVIISVVTGVIDNDNPITPTNPAVDSDDTVPGGNPQTATYVQSKDVSVAYSGVSHSTGSGYSGPGSTGDTTDVKTTEIIEGQYTAPLGVTTTTTATNIVENNNALAVGLAVTATVAAASGVIFFIAGKRDDDDDEEEQV